LEGIVKNVRVALVALATGAALLSCTRPHRPDRPDPTPKEKVPVIFVHGYAQTGVIWDAAVTYFTEQGYEADDLTRFEYKSQGEGAVNATQAATALAETVETVRRGTRGGRVDIVAHSLGNLVTKTCIVEGGCRNKVAHWGNIAGAQNGTALAAPEYCPDPACVDMRPGSELITRLQAADDTQIDRQNVEVQVHWSAMDGIIVPPEGSKEVYADNIQVADTITHQTIFSDPGVLRDTVTFLADQPGRDQPPGTRPGTTRPRPVPTTTVGGHGHGGH
jgi:triacylglycerol lipase